MCPDLQQKLPKFLYDKKWEHNPLLARAGVRSPLKMNGNYLQQNTQFSYQQVKIIMFLDTITPTYNKFSASGCLSPMHTEGKREFADLEIVSLHTDYQN